MTEEDLQGLFEQYGSVSNVSIIKDRETGRAKGFGFVEMDEQNDGENAIKELDGSDVQGRNIKVNEAKPREERAPRTPRKPW